MTLKKDIFPIKRDGDGLKDKYRRFAVRVGLYLFAVFIAFALAVERIGEGIGNDVE